MITGELKSKVDRIWDTMWSGGISNPLSVIEQLTYLLFIKRLDELHTLKERAFSQFLNDRSLTQQQIRFVEMIIDQLTARGVMEPSALYDAPFSNLHVGGPDALFAGKDNVVQGIFDTLKEMHSNLASQAA